jgi:outer membrane protein
VVLALALAALPASGQTMIEAMVLAYNSNPDLLAARARLRVVDEGVSQAMAGWRPTVSVTGQYGYVRSDRITNNSRNPVNLNDRGGQIQITQPIYRGGRTVAATAQAEADVRAQRAALMDAEQVVLLNVVTTYTDTLRDRVTVNLRRNNVNVLLQQLQSTEARFNVGELTRTDVAQAQARLERSRSDLTLAVANEATSRAQFFRVVGIQPGQLTLPPILGTAPGTEDEAIAIAENRAPRNVSAQHRITSARAAVDVAFGVLLPQVSVVGNLQRFYDQQFKSDRIFEYSVLGQVTIPLYQGGAEYSQVRSAKQTVGQRAAEFDSARRQTSETMIRAWQNLQAAKSRVVSFTAQVQANAIALDGVRQEQQVGSRTIIEVLNAEQEYLDSQVQLVIARRDVIVAHYTVIAELGQLNARSLGLPVEYYDEEINYNDVRNRWIGLGNYGVNGGPSQPAPTPAGATRR